jgi:hypothetical protein
MSSKLSTEASVIASANGIDYADYDEYEIKNNTFILNVISNEI